MLIEIRGMNEWLYCPIWSNMIINMCKQWGQTAYQGRWMIDTVFGGAVQCTVRLRLSSCPDPHDFSFAQYCACCINRDPGVPWEPCLWSFAGKQMEATLVMSQCSPTPQQVMGHLLLHTLPIWNMIRRATQWQLCRPFLHLAWKESLLKEMRDY